MEIGLMRSRIILKSWGSYQDPGGGPIAIIVNTYTLWAKVEQRSGQMYSGEQQPIWTYDYKVTFRYEKSRIPASNFTIDYDGKRLAIKSIGFSEEGNRKYVIARCSTIDANINTDNDIFATVGTFDYYGIGPVGVNPGEDNFTADGTPLGLPKTIPQDLRNKTIIGAYKDGEFFNTILTLPFDPVIKQVLYNPATGNFLWSIPFEYDEHATIQFIEPCDCES